MIDFMLANLDKLFVDFRSCSYNLLCMARNHTAARVKTMFIYLIYPRKFCQLTNVIHAFGNSNISQSRQVLFYIYIYICSQFHHFKLGCPFCLPKSAVGLMPLYLIN